MFKHQSRRIRAVLRIPRLCREFHEMVTKEKMSEFKSLESIYKKHFIEKTDGLTQVEK